uniref:Uncharacterized protein n=1 Tax=Moniliophthora roreri TaxID=221103 RepID=A0A0W0F1W1_MONRR
MPVPHPSPYALRPASHPPKYIPQYTFPYFSGFGLLPACSLVKFILNAIALSQPEEREGERFDSESGFEHLSEEKFEAFNLDNTTESHSQQNYGHTISRAGDWDGHGRQGKVYWGSQGKGCWSD